MGNTLSTMDLISPASIMALSAINSSSLSPAKAKVADLSVNQFVNKDLTMVEMVGFAER